LNSLAYFWYDGYSVGARDLTWSYVAFQTASDARQRLAVALDTTSLQFATNTAITPNRTGKVVNVEEVIIEEGWSLMRGVELVMNWVRGFLI